MTSSLYFSIFYLQTILSAIVACASFYSFRERSTSSKLVGLLFSFSFLFNVSAYILLTFWNINPNFISNLYGFLLVIILTTLYNYNTEKRYSKWFIVSGVSVVVFGLVNLFFFQKNDASFNDLVSSLLILAYCLVYFYRLIIELPTANVLRLPMFWITSGFLFFHAGTLFLFAFKHYLVNVLQNDLVTYWGFHNIVSIVQHGIIFVGLYFDIKREKGAEIHHHQV